MIFNQSPLVDHSYFQKLGIQQLATSRFLFHFADRFQKKYHLIPYENDQKSTLFFGIYRNIDLERLIKHKGKKFVMFGGTDVEKLKKNREWCNLINQQEICKFFTISNNLESRVKKLGFSSQQINISFHDDQLFNSNVRLNYLTEGFRPDFSKFGNKIYIYNGYSPGNEKLYGKKIYEEVVKKLPQYQYIYSNRLGLKHEQMPSIYAQCFIGLRLTVNDGNANTVQEMTAMGIPVIHNGEQGGLSWKTVDDIISLIQLHSPRE